MATALNDPSLLSDPIPIDPSVTDEDEEGFLGLDVDDIRDLILNLRVPVKLSVGLYTGRDLLDLFSRHQIPETLHRLPGRSFVASHRSPNIAMKCGWVELGDQSIYNYPARAGNISCKYPRA
jgi:hypothetical protein